MANVWYQKGMREIGNQGVALLTANVKIVLFDNGYTPDYVADEFLSSVPAGARIVTSPNLSGKTIADGGVFDFDDPTFTGAAVGKVIIGAALYKDTGSAATSPLIGLTNTAGGLPLTTDGTVITMSIDGAGYGKL